MSKKLTVKFQEKEFIIIEGGGSLELTFHGFREKPHTFNSNSLQAIESIYEQLTNIPICEIVSIEKVVT